MKLTQIYTASCFCDSVELSVKGEPEAMGYCHCTSCRLWSAGPVNAFTLWRPEALTIEKGESYIAGFGKTPQSHRKWCTRCGGHLFTEHPDLGLVDVYAALLKEFPFQPAVHVHYQERVLPIVDGLPKLRDVPVEMGGSGEELPER